MLEVRRHGLGVNKEGNWGGRVWEQDLMDGMAVLGQRFDDRRCATRIVGAGGAGVEMVKMPP